MTTSWLALRSRTSIVEIPDDHAARALADATLAAGGDVAVHPADAHGYSFPQHFRRLARARDRAARAALTALANVTALPVPTRRRPPRRHKTL